jgi:hypothetical protein
MAAFSSGKQKFEIANMAFQLPVELFFQLISARFM